VLTRWVKPRRMANINEHRLLLHAISGQLPFLG
jgi:hypothetical protein